MTAERSHSVVCSQVGAREHYAVPRALSRLGCLDTLLTDVWANRQSRVLAGFSWGRRLAARRHTEIPNGRVVAFTASTLIDSALHGISKSRRSVEDTYLHHLRVGSRFARRVRSFLMTRARAAGPPSAFFAYTTGALEALEFLEDAGIPTVVDQIDPGRTVDEIARREAELWPDFMATPQRIPEAYFQRLEAEWAKANRVIVNSDWSRKALVQQGVPQAKIVVVPVAYDPPAVMLPRRPAGDRLTVLWLGQVILLKGIQYLIQAAREIHDERLRFVVAGPIGISVDAIRAAPANMSFVGPVTRDRVASLYQAADLFVFPTLSDGFGVVQLEALAHGVPVIATSNCGDVVTDGLDGRIIPARDPKALAGAILELAADKERLHAMSAAATETAKRFSVDVLARRLVGILDELA